MSKGIDYAWHGAINWSCLKSSGVTFIARYLSHDPSKDLTADEKNQANTNGIAVCVVWETTANRMLAGHDGGVADAKETDNRLKSLGMGGCPAYFACDWDASEADQAAINAYLDGAASIIGRPRTGMYSGYHPMRRAFDAGKITYGWQTYAWSGGAWDNRAQLRQTQNGVTVCGISADWDESVKSDYAQWPRPGAPTTPAPPAGGGQAPPPFPYPASGYIGTARPDPDCHSGCYGPPDSDQTARWQRQMSDRGWPISVDGCFGPQSEGVCRQFQAEKSLPADGLVGPQTWAASWAAPIT